MTTAHGPDLASTLKELIDTYFPPMYYAINDEVTEGTVLIMQASDSGPETFIFKTIEDVKMIGDTCRCRMVHVREWRIAAPQTLRSGEPDTHPK